MSKSEFIYLTSLKGKDLIPGQVIISHQAYGTILEISPDFIFTSTGNRKLYPEHLYPVFILSKKSAAPDS